MTVSEVGRNPTFLTQQGVIVEDFSIEPRL
jgi:hypothetical protein